jgi:Flp pilus assembly secretin CpaC
MTSFRQFSAAVAVTVLGVVTVLSAPAVAADTERLYLTTDRSQVVVFPGEPFTKLSITNPNVADVSVLSPTQLVLSGKSTGVTTLMVISPSKLRTFDVIVNPAPIVSTSAPLAGEAHAVLVHRAGKVTEHLFGRDRTEGWVELGAMKPEEAPKK